MVEQSNFDRMKQQVRSVIGEGREAEHENLVSLYMKFPITYEEWQAIHNKMQKRFGVASYRTGYWVFLPRQQSELLMNEYKEGEYQFVQLKKGEEDMDLQLQDVKPGESIRIMEGEEKDVIAIKLNHEPVDGDYVVAVITMSGNMEFKRGDMLWLTGKTKVKNAH